jgi:hypothetical protein
MPVERRTKVVESCKELVRGKLFQPGGYSTEDVSIVDALTGTQFTGKLDKTYVGAGYMFDDGGRQAEIGSDLQRYIWTVEYLVFAPNMTWGKSVADAVGAAFPVGDNIPLLDIGGSRAPTGETAIVTYSQAQRVVVRAPRPWEEYIYQVRAKIEDYFYASQP